MAIAHVGTETAYADTTGLSVPIHASAAVGNLVLIAVTYASNRTVSTPSGWVVIASVGTAAGNASIPATTVFGRVRRSGDASSVTVSVNFSTRVAAVSNVYSGTAGLPAVTATATGSGTTATAPTVTTRAANSVVLRVIGAGSALSLATDTVSLSTPTSHTARGEVEQAMAGGSYDIAQASVGASGTASSTLGRSVNWNATSLVIAPYGDVPNARMAGTSGGTTADVTPMYPPADGDLLVYLMQTRNSLPASAGPEGGGWTKLFEYDVNSASVDDVIGTDDILVCWYRFADASEPESYTWTVTDNGTDAQVSLLAVYPGMEVLDWSVVFGTTTADPGTSAAAGDALLAFFGSSFESGSYTGTPPTGMLLIDYLANVAAAGVFGIAAGQTLSSGAVGTKAIAHTSMDAFVTAAAIHLTTASSGQTGEPDPILVTVSAEDVTATPGNVTAEPDPLVVTVTAENVEAIVGVVAEPDPLLVTVTFDNVTATLGNVTAEPDPITVTVTVEDVTGDDGAGDSFTGVGDPILVTITVSEPAATGGVALAVFEVEEYTDDTLDFEAVLTVEVVPEPVPVTLSVEPVQRTSVTMSALPALTDGVPDPDAYTATVTRQDVGYWQVVIDGLDVTYFRDVPVEVGDFGSADPFGDTTATLRFPQITPFEALGTGSLDWLRDFVTVEIYLVPTDYPTTPKRVLYEGEVASYDDSSTDLGVVCLGALYEVDLGLALPHYYREPKTAEKQLRWLFAPYSWRRLHLRTRSMRFAFPSGWTRVDDSGDLWTGFWRHEAESWERPVTGLAAEYLAGMIETDGTQWTILHAPGRKPILQQRDTTTVDYTVTCGAHGVTHDLRDDATQRVNVFFGEGTDRAGTTWRNMHPLSEWVEYQPVAIELEASARMPDSVGTDPEVNPDYDPSIVRVEQHIAFGSGIGLDTAQAVAARQIARNGDGAWAGSITLETDPEEASRFTIRGGDNILLKNHRGTDRLFHVASVRHTPQSSTLTVDTAGRDYLTVEKLIARRREASVSPARRLAYGTESTTPDDTRAPWDDYAAAGHIPRASREWPDGTLRRRNHKQTTYPPSSNPDLYVEVVGGKWSYSPVVVGQKGTARRFELYAYGTAGARKSVRFFAGIWTARHSKSLLPDNPLAITWRDWLTDDFDSLMESRVLAHGQSGQAAGYWPGLESDGDSVTGALVDEGSWQWELEPGENTLWLALWSPDDAFFQGRIVHGVQ